MADQLDELTERQHYWLEHIRACEAAGQSTLQYAQAHGFESRAMYKARKLLVEKGFWPTAKGCGHSSHFQKVRVTSSGQANNQWRVQLPNGVRVTFGGQVDAKALSVVLKAAASLS